METLKDDEKLALLAERFEEAQAKTDEIVHIYLFLSDNDEKESERESEREKRKKEREKSDT